jgi:HEAT repeat protein
MGRVRARWIACLLAATAYSQEGDGAAGKGEDPVAVLLNHPDAKTRARAARAIGRAKHERGVEAAGVALADADETVRTAAAVALVRLGAAGEKAIDVLTASLRSADWYTRFDACVALGSLGPAAAVAAPALVAAAGDPGLDLSREAANALVRIVPKDPQVAAALVLLLESDRDLDRKSLLRALSATGQIALAQDWLAKELVADRYGLRARAATLLGTCGVKGVAYLEESLKNENPAVRARAIYALEDAEKVGPAVFVATLSDPAPEMRRAAIYVLRRRNAVAEAPRIAAMLGDPDRDVRWSAAWALEEFAVAVPEAGPGLVRLAAGGDKGVADAALRAMSVTGFAALATFLECGLDPDKLVWTVRLKPSGGSEDLAGHLHHLVARIEDNRHGGALVAALRDTLAADEDAILAGLLEDDDDELRRTAAILLGHLARDRELSTRALEKALKDEHPDVRDAAAAAIKRLR